MERVTELNFVCHAFRKLFANVRIRCGCEKLCNPVTRVCAKVCHKYSAYDTETDTSFIRASRAKFNNATKFKPEQRRRIDVNVSSAEVFLSTDARRLSSSMEIRDATRRSSG